MIEIKDVVKQYGEVRAADGVSFVAPAGKVTALLGPNGAGKTTTMRILLGLSRPESGTALIDGRRYEDLQGLRGTVGVGADGRGRGARRVEVRRGAGSVGLAGDSGSGEGRRGMRRLV